MDVDPVLFWKIVDSKKAALDVADYQSAISWAFQTVLRDVIGKTMLSDILEGRDKISDVLHKIIDERTEPWGINVISVEVKDVLIPASLEDAMSMQAREWFTDHNAALDRGLLPGRYGMLAFIQVQ